ncbi:uncharacterized protein IL334_005055 [Kwoniella shivajii]|uniref:Uncharacterized protein n=1 Tax=Kwoniella shivajii TaxID=564305 RepID=A0ABZ1D230_9TREE|nr:hypothetical protein IL334_005055 [Kwoniella shivajii]
MSNVTSSVGLVPGMSGMDVNTILWKQMGSSVPSTTWYATVGTIIQALIVSSILSNTLSYFEYFTQSDSIWLLEAVGLGAIMSVGALGLTSAQAYKLIHENETNIASHFRFLMLADMSHLLIGAIFNAAGAVYYTYRAWRMSGNKWYIVPPFALGVIAQFAVAIIAVVNGLKMPHLTIEVVKDLQEIMGGTIKWFQAWGAITFAVDGILCLFMTFMLFKSKQGIFHNQSKLFKKLISLVYETMLPPVLCLLILESTSSKAGSPLTDFRRIFTSILPVLYYHSVLSTLVGRQTIRKILDRKLIKEGVDVFSGSRSRSGSGSGLGSGSGSNGHVNKNGGRIFVSRQVQRDRNPDHNDKEKNLELGIISSPFTPKSKSDSPFVLIETEQSQSVVGPDGVEHHHLPTLGRNRLQSNRSQEDDVTTWDHPPNSWASTDRLYDGPGRAA